MLALRIAVLVFGSAVIQVSAVTGSTVLGGELDLLLLTIIGVALLAGAVPGAIAGFAGGLLVDVMTLGTLGFTSVLLTLAGYWAGRYGETTGRGRAYAPSLTAFALTLLVGIAAIALHYMLGDAVAGRVALTPLLPSALLAAVVAVPVHRVVRAVVHTRRHIEPTGQVELV